MRLVRFGESGRERPGLLDPQGIVRDVSAHLADWHGAHWAGNRSGGSDP
jgi:2,4-didehydro-3-deoxy-L-rhamnonate hydrolase